MARNKQTLAATESRKIVADIFKLKRSGADIKIQSGRHWPGLQQMPAQRGHHRQRGREPLRLPVACKVLKHIERVPAGAGK